MSQDGGRVTISDVAVRAGVSRALVSIVLRGVAGASDESRRRVRQAAEELDYRPDQRARLLRSARSRQVGVVFGLHADFHADLVDHLYRAAEGTGYELALGAATPARDERRAVQSLLDYRCEALLLLGPALARRSIEELAERVPVVVLARALRSRAVDVVRTDDVAGARLAVEHLATLGHREIAHVDGQRAPGAAERRRGYRAAMREAGLAAYETLVPGGPTEEDGEAAAARLLADRAPAAPTAVTAFNDHCAAGLMAAARDSGLGVPGDLSVVGFDDSRIAGLSIVALTTIAQDAPALARSALRLALRRVEDPAVGPTEVVVAPRLVNRRTTAPPRGLPPG